MWLLLQLNLTLNPNLALTFYYIIDPPLYSKDTHSIVVAWRYLAASVLAVADLFHGAATLWNSPLGFLNCGLPSLCFLSCSLPSLCLLSCGLGQWSLSLLLLWRPWGICWGDCYPYLLCVPCLPQPWGFMCGILAVSTAYYCDVPARSAANNCCVSAGDATSYYLYLCWRSLVLFQYRIWLLRGAML